MPRPVRHSRLAAAWAQPVLPLALIPPDEDLESETNFDLANVGRDQVREPLDGRGQLGRHMGLDRAGELTPEPEATGCSSTRSHAHPPTAPGAAQLPSV